MSSGPYTRSKARRDKINVVDKRREEENDEFPILKELGLYAAAIKGDGNCLFRSMSDQLYGDGGNRHTELRRNIVEYMSNHGDYFSMFIGSGESWPSYLARMKQDGVYGDNLEIVAFARLYEVDVVIYQYDFQYVVTNSEKPSSSKQVHIVYHSWEHYSSVRNLEGPHSGLPEVKPKQNSNTGATGATVASSKPSATAPWKVDVVRKSLPFSLGDDAIKRCLEMHNGDISGVVEELIMGGEEEGAELGGAQASSETSDPENSKLKSESQGPSEIDASHGGEAPINHQSPPGAGAGAGAEAEASHESPRQTGKRPKRVTAREKKERQKKQALQRKRASKEQPGVVTAGGASNAMAPTPNNGSAISSSIRSMYI